MLKKVQTQLKYRWTNEKICNKSGPTKITLENTDFFFLVIPNRSFSAESVKDCHTAGLRENLCSPWGCSYFHFPQACFLLSQLFLRIGSRALKFKFSVQRVNLNVITNGSAFEMSAAWQLQLGTLWRASIMYAASLRNSFTHLTQGPLCCGHEIKLYVGIVSSLYPLHAAGLHSLPPPCTCMHTHALTHPTNSFIVILFLFFQQSEYINIIIISIMALITFFVIKISWF